MKDDKHIRQQAMNLFEQAYQHQMQGELGNAIALYKRSIDTYPTAEAYTYLGWTYSLLGHYEQAITMCHKAIEIDPDYGNPYNDIGAYLIELGQHEDAIVWLEQALMAPRYETPHFPLLNLGRAFEALGQYERALAFYQQAIEIAPLYLPARWAKQALLGRMN